MTYPPREDPRLQQLVDGIVQLAAGDLSARITPSPNRDDIDAVIIGVNLLAEELHYIYSDLEQRVQERTARLREAQVELSRMAMTDSLTGLANRAVLEERIQAAILAAEAGGPAPALLTLDLDSFKSINDRLGHRTGDEVLVEVGRRLSAAVRSTDTVARLGGDEFAILIPRATEQETVRIALRALESLRENIQVGTASLWATASIGVSLGMPGCTAATMLRDSDIAMYEAKSRGRNNIQSFRPDFLAATRERSRIADELRHAIATQALALHYQPVVELASGRTIGVEALLRWQHPSRGLVMPANFISIAEETGLITDLGRWVLTEAVAQLRRWRTAAPQLPEFKLHVNLSAAELRRVELLEEVAGVLAENDVDAGSLIFEITETVLMTRGTEEAQALSQLRGLGVGLQIDDFGTGYSSISYLRSLPADTVKVDQSLIVGMGTDPEQHKFIAAVLQLIASAGLDAIVEGIETAEQAAQLRRLGCLYGQGYFFGRPVPPDQLLARLQGRPRASGNESRVSSC